MELLEAIQRHNYLFNGIYRITNIKTKKFYIGSCSASDYIYVRLKHHYGDLINNKHINKYLQRSWNKYGSSNFYVDILEICNPEDCLIREQYWIDLLQPIYNFCKIAGNTSGRIPSEETKNKISQSNKNWYNTEKGTIFKKKLSDLRKGKSGHKHSEETKKIISEKNKGKTVSEESKQKMKIKRPSLNKKIIDLNTNIIYNSAEEYSNLFNISIGYIRMLARKEKLSKKHNIAYYD